MHVFIIVFTILHVHVNVMFFILAYYLCILIYSLLLFVVVYLFLLLFSDEMGLGKSLQCITLIWYSTIVSLP